MVPSDTMLMEVRGRGPSPFLPVSLVHSKGRGCGWAPGRGAGPSLAQPLMLPVSAPQLSACPCHGDLL